MPDASVAPEAASAAERGSPPPALGCPCLAAGFPAQGREDWQRLVAAVLNKTRAEDARLDGPAAERVLRRRLEGGLEVDALYLREDRPLGAPGTMPFTRGRAAARRDPFPGTSASSTTTRTPPPPAPRCSTTSSTA